jgi:pectate lyase
MKFLFACNETPLELKARLKESGLKGRALSNQISAIRRGDSSLAWVQHNYFMEGMRKEGFLPVQADKLSKTGVVRYSKFDEAKESKATISKTLETAIRNLMAKIDCSYEEALAYVS